MRRHSLFLCLLSLAVAGCAHTAGLPPDDMLRCRDEPEAPSGVVTDEQNGTYLRSLRGAWLDCRSKLNWIRDWSESMRKN